MAITAAEREAAHRRAQAETRHCGRLARLHRQSWPSSAAPSAPARPDLVAPRPPAPPTRPAVEPFARALLAGVPRWRLGERRVARRLAAEQAEASFRQAQQAHQAELAVHEQRLAAHHRAQAREEHERAAEQRLLDHVHERLLAGERTASERAIAAALDDLPAAARLVGWHAHAAVVTVTAPALNVVPEREPDWTAAGRPTTRKLNRTERNDRYAEIVAALTIAAARRALAAAPGVRVVISATLDATPAVLAHCRVSQRSGVPGDDPIGAIYELDGDLEQAGRTRTLAAVDASGRPELERLTAEGRGSGSTGSARTSR